MKRWEYFKCPFCGQEHKFDIDVMEVGTYACDISCDVCGGFFFGVDKLSRCDKCNRKDAFCLGAPIIEAYKIKEKNGELAESGLRGRYR